MKHNRYFNTNIIRNALIGFTLFVLLLFLYLSIVNFIVFHTIFEFSIMTLGIISSTIGVFTSFKLKDNMLSKISPAMFVYTVFIFIHILAYADIIVSAADNENLSAAAWIIANTIICFGFLISILDDKGKVSVPFRLVISFTIGIVFFVLVLLGLLPPAMSNGVETSVYRTLQWIIIISYFVSIIVFSLNKKLREKKIYHSLFIALVGLFISEILLFNHFSNEGFIIYLGLSFRFSSFMFLMYSVLKVNLIEPYNKLYQSIYKDNVLLKKLSKEINISIHRLSRTQKIGHVGSWELDLKTKKIWASDEAFRIYGMEIPNDNFLPLDTVQRFVSIDDRPRLDLALLNLIEKNSDYNINFSITNQKGEYHYINSVATLKYVDGSPAMVYGVINDITSLKLEQDKLRYASYHDHLTNVYNRRYFVEQRAALDFQQYLPISTAILDINGLKIINDSFGHHAGNNVLKSIARTLKNNTTKDNCFVARIGGDEFAIIYPNTNIDEAETLVLDIIHKISQEKVGNINLSIAYGVASKTDISESFDAVLKQAEDDMYLHKISDSQSVRNKIIDALLKTLYQKDTMSEEHSQRVSELSFELAKASDLSEKKASDIKVAGLLHDIGKITINNEILNKKGKLTDSEYQIIKMHPEKGYKIIHSIGSMDIIANYVFQHHEKIDGTGYPNGLKGDDISLEARIICIADAYDAMTSYRNYKDILTKEQAISELIRCKGNHFDAKLVDIFINKVLNKD